MSYTNIGAFVNMRRLPSNAVGGNVLHRANPVRRHHYHRPMLLKLSTTLPCSLEEAVKQVQSPRLLRFVASPLVQFTPVDPPAFPETWSAGTYWVQMTLFGLVPIGRQAIVISFPVVKSGFALVDNGHSALIKSWDHLITITPSEHGSHYEDRVNLSAGLLTPFVFAFAWIFYRHRQRRWRLLASRGFDYGYV